MTFEISTIWQETGRRLTAKGKQHTYEHKIEIDMVDIIILLSANRMIVMS